MAGSDPTGETDIQLIDVDKLLGRIESQRDLLQEIADTLKASNRARSIISLQAVSASVTDVYVGHTRFFVERINITAVPPTGGFIAELRVGSITHRFFHTNAQPRATEFPIVIDRGVDVSVAFFDNAGAAAAVAFGYVHIIGTVE